MSGYLDFIEGGNVCGWAQHGAAVEISIGNAVIGRAEAKLDRPDVRLAGFSDSRGFALAIPADIEFRADSTVNAMVDGEPLQQSGRTVSTLLCDQSLVFGQDGRRIIGGALETREAIEAIIGKIGDGYDLDVLARFAAAWSSAQFVNAHLGAARRFADSMEQLRWAAGEAGNGLYLEFGVWSGHSIREIAALRPDDRVFGFDAFQGLPEDWTAKAGRGAFPAPVLPDLPQNVSLAVGWFDETLPGFCRDHSGEIVSLMHIDCDLYSSTKTVFDNIAPLLREGTIIVFDEYFNYPGWEKHEHRAFDEFLAAAPFTFDYLSFVPRGSQLCGRLRSC
jgi:predicted O-methyltransferase YrrM